MEARSEEIVRQMTALQSEYREIQAKLRRPKTKEETIYYVWT
jgi:hypothetical protein